MFSFFLSSYYTTNLQFYNAIKLKVMTKYAKTCSSAINRGVIKKAAPGDNLNPICV